MGESAKLYLATQAAQVLLPVESPFKVCISVEITRTPDGRFESIVGPAGMDKHQPWGTGGVGDTLAKALIQSVSRFELLEQETPESLHKDYRGILEEIRRASGLGPLPPPPWWSRPCIKKLAFHGVLLPCGKS